ncbi:MAG TPA: Ig-like domain repeat protein, partial [Terriglobales bacterium]|nr:Ig-like domain repeat protein [Terriglobales bacterium]
ITEFPTGATTDPWFIAAGKDGNLWFTNHAFTGTDSIGRMSTNGTVTLFSLPNGSGTTGIVSGPDGNIWFTEYGEPRIGKVVVGTNPVVTEIPIPSRKYPSSIIIGPDGNLWFREAGSGIPTEKQLATVALPSATITEFSLGISLGGNGMTAGPDGNLWLTDSAAAGNQILKVSVSATLLSQFPFGSSGPFPQPNFITAGPDGNLWFTELAGGCIGRITPAGSVTQFCGGPSFGQRITSGPDGAVWFTDLSGGIGRIDATGNIKEWSIRGAPGNNAALPNGIATGPDGNLWVADNYAVIERFTPTDPPVETDFAVGGSSSTQVTWDITAGPDGNLWFTDALNLAVGKITTSGVIQEYALPLPLGYSPTGIAVGPDGNLWIQSQDYLSGAVGKVTTAGVASEFSVGLSGFAQDIVAGPDGGLWIPDDGLLPAKLQIAEVSTAGTLLQELPTTYLGSGAQGITVGPDHKLWFTEFFGARIGRMSAIHGNGNAISAVAGNTFTGAVASFVDGTPTATVADFTATISWGDGVITAGTVSGPAGGPFQVSGTHTYAGLGNLGLTIILHDSVDDEDYSALGSASVVGAVPTTTVLASSLNPAQAGQSVTFTATVGSGSGTPTGNVQFEDFGSAIGSSTLNGSAIATLIISSLATGPHSITAAYLGDGSHFASASNAVDEIVKTSTQTTTTLALAPSATMVVGPFRQRNVTLTATLTPGAGSATGKVSFYDGRLLGSAQLDGTGHASIIVPLNTGSNSLTCAYAGDTNFAASISPVVVAYRSPKPR